MFNLRFYSNRANRGPDAEAKGRSPRAGGMHRNGRNIVEDGKAVACRRRLLQVRPPNGTCGGESTDILVSILRKANR
ncbi:hypothetical protein N182_34895 [Sinorhizobium sp. GL2]|nr:hypothetical protein N182_34895 [Sinorhizobium sp. GL2]